MQLLGNLGTHLGSVAIDGLPAAHDDVVSLYADLVDGRSQDLRGGVCIGTAELAGGHQHGLVSAHSQRLAEHTGSGRRTHGHHNNLAAGGVLDLQGRLQGVHIVGVGDGLHGRTVQGAVRIHRRLTGGVGNLLDGNNDFHVNLYLLSYFTPRRLEITIRWTSLVPS